MFGSEWRDERLLVFVSCNFDISDRTPLTLCANYGI